ncbi:MAG: VanZ family protein [Anaerolineae bacterium]|nr:VanZ family protein [Anaerolineae bacterium]
MINKLTVTSALTWAVHVPRPLRIVLTAAYLTVLTAVLLQPSQRPLLGPAAPKTYDLGWDILLTLAHVVGFGLLTFLLWWMLYHPAPFRWALRTAVLCACVLGVATEFLQSMVPDRSVSLLDLLVNCGVALLVAHLIARAQQPDTTNEKG